MLRIDPCRWLFLFLVTIAHSVATDAAEKPNIVWLISEDNSMHYLKLFDEHGVETPRIAELASTGLKFNNAFSNAPVCSVARTTLMTSCYGPRIGTQFHRRSALVPMPDDVKMFPAYLREAGYYTTNKQKKDYNAVETKGTWDESSNKASWRNRKDGQAFFHMQSFGTSHESSLHFSQEVYESQRTETDPESVFVPPYFPDTKLFRYTIATYHDKIRAVDQQIGQVVDELRKDGLLEDTFVFYFGDHGGVLPRGKGYAYESGLHVPLVIHVPKNFARLSPWKRNSEIDGFVQFVDFGATALNLAGIALPSGIDGQAFLGAGVKQNDVAGREESFGYADRFDEKYDLVRSLRLGRFHYIRNYQPFNFDGLQNNYRYIMLAYREWRTLYQEGKLNEQQSQFFRTRPVEQLFDVEKDPHEVKNLAQDPRYADVLIDSRERLQDRVRSLPDLSLYPECYLAEHAFDNPTGFGQGRKEEIARLADIADLSLLRFEDSSEDITAALESESPLERYWGVIVCSCFGTKASSLADKVRSLRDSDADLLVRTRAAEYLGLFAGEDPRPTIRECLEVSESGIKTNMILNTAVLLKDSEPGYPMAISDETLNAKVLNFQDVRRRLAYFGAKDGIPKNPRGVRKNKRRK